MVLPGTVSVLVTITLLSFSSASVQQLLAAPPGSSPKSDPEMLENEVLLQ